MGQTIGRRRAETICIALILSAAALLWQWSSVSRSSSAQAANYLEVHTQGARSAAPTVRVLPAQELQMAATLDHPAYSLYVPAGPEMPRTVLLALHGMSGSGPAVAAPLREYAQSQNWVLVAPTITYGDWQNPTQVAGEDIRLGPQLAAMLDAIPSETGTALGSHLLLFGFSRGAQEALRFTMLYPSRVTAVAAISAGTYTMPVRAVKTLAGTTMDAPMPYGVADMAQLAGHDLDTAALARVRFLIQVGAGDNQPNDVPHQWDPYEGRTRVERAQSFGASLAQVGCQEQVVVVEGAGHEVNQAMLERAQAFLGQADADAQARDEALATDPPIVAPTPAGTIAPGGPALPASRREPRGV